MKATSINAPAGSGVSKAASKTNGSTGGANAVALASSSTPYRTAWIWAAKPGASDNDLPSVNTQNVYIVPGDDNVKEGWPLSPGASMDLPPHGDLADFDLVVTVADEGVIIHYTT